MPGRRRKPTRAAVDSSGHSSLSGHSLVLLPLGFPSCPQAVCPSLPCQCWVLRLTARLCKVRAHNAHGNLQHLLAYHLPTCGREASVTTLAVAFSSVPALVP